MRSISTHSTFLLPKVSVLSLQTLNLVSKNKHCIGRHQTNIFRVSRRATLLVVTISLQRDKSIQVCVPSNLNKCDLKK